MRHVTVLIPARFQATRFPGKPLTPILGKPMIQWVYERSAKSCADRVIVATDSDRIFACVVGFGGEAEMTRADHANGSQRIAEVAERIETDIVVNVQGDEPTLHPSAIDRVIAPFSTDPDLPMATLCEAMKDHAQMFNPNVVKVVCDARGRALYFSRAPIPFLKHVGMNAISWPADRAVGFLKHVGVYAYRRDFLLEYQAHPPCELEQIEGLEQLRALDMGARIQVERTPHPTLHVDVPDDVARVESFLKQKRWDV